MCRVLVRWKSKERAMDNEVKWECTKRQRGDIVDVRPDGFEWGTAECLPDYVSLDMAGVPVDEIKQYKVYKEASTLVDHRGKSFIRHKRPFAVMLDELPKAIRDGLKKDGKADVSLADLRGRILHKESGIRR